MYFRELRDIQKAWKTRNIQKARKTRKTQKAQKTRNIQKNRKTLQYTHGESNPNQRNRNPSFYPLNYGCIIGL